MNDIMLYITKFLIGAMRITVSITDFIAEAGESVTWFDNRNPVSYAMNTFMGLLIISIVVGAFVTAVVFACMAMWFFITTFPKLTITITSIFCFFIFCGYLSKGK